MGSDQTMVTICPHCGQRFDIPAHREGRKLLCRCGELLVVGAKPALAIPVETIHDTTVEEPASPQSASPVRVISYRSPSTPTTIEIPAFSPFDFTWRGFWLPLGMILVGLPMYLALWIHWRGWPGGLTRFAIQVPINVFILTWAIIITARFADMTLGSIGSVIFRIAAISIFPPAAIGWMFADLYCGAIVMGIPLGFGLFVSAYMILFEVEITEAIMCSAVTIAPWLCWLVLWWYFFL